jgi:hypothetical protein
VSECIYIEVVLKHCACVFSNFCTWITVGTFTELFFNASSMDLKETEWEDVDWIHVTQDRVNKLKEFFILLAL